MSTSTGAFVLAAASRKKSSRKVLPQHFFASAAIAGLVLGCAWTVYTNIFAASVYPSMGSAAFDAPVVKGTAAVAARPAPTSFTEVFASLPPPRALSKPESDAASIMFNERFAASAPQSEPSRVAAAAPQADAPNLVEAPKPVAAPKLAETSKAIVTPKLAEAPKTKQAAGSTQVALNTPTAPVETKPAAKSAIPSVTWRSAPRPR